MMRRRIFIAGGALTLATQAANDVAARLGGPPHPDALHTVLLALALAGAFPFVAYLTGWRDPC